MDIKWSYYLIGLIYILVIVLKMINNSKSKTFKEQYPKAIKILILKRDFFTTVSLCCTVGTLFINGAALWGNKPFNTSSLLITFLVLGFTYFNSVSTLFIDEEAHKAFLIGYELCPEEIESHKVKVKKNMNFYEMNFTKEIDSYNYIKFISFGQNKNKIEFLWDVKK
ncbi:hypothetical protein CS063_00300 [Sporanaerobium hydrogeniformans]|uniref:Uncharacterized protein n=1 Tax=Sporanaerobium hydrogeniformans TaxID=3072179 RepID=A0AC61DG65_9FIRM|nr:hypothetical protein [Sporanaerobium hydrogeniformans]PHV71952.1 hypothetical protein CS063_00300 [Sporanaerobium hydrogeniformans]